MGLFVLLFRSSGRGRGSRGCCRSRRCSRCRGGRGSGCCLRGRGGDGRGRSRGGRGSGLCQGDLSGQAQSQAGDHREDAGVFCCGHVNFRKVNETQMEFTAFKLGPSPSQGVQLKKAFKRVAHPLALGWCLAPPLLSDSSNSLSNLRWCSLNLMGVSMLMWQ